jgi:hypothetical protein
MSGVDYNAENPFDDQTANPFEVFNSTFLAEVYWKAYF